MQKIAASAAVFALLVALWIPAVVEGRDLLGRHINVKAKCKFGRRGCSFRVPTSATSCSIAFGGALPLATCPVLVGAPTFGSSFLINLPDISQSTTCTLLPNGIQVPEIACPGGLGRVNVATGVSGVGVSGVGVSGAGVVGGLTAGGSISFPPGTVTSEPVLIGNTLIPSPGSGRCSADRSSLSDNFVISCEPAAPGAPSFPPGTLLELKDGDFSCDFIATASGPPQKQCAAPSSGVPAVPPPMSVAPPTEPIVNGNSFTPPPGSGECRAGRRSAGGPISVTCTPGTPSFPPGTVLEVPSNAGSCTFAARAGDTPLISCVGIPVTAPPPSPIAPPVTIPRPKKKKHGHG